MSTLCVASFLRLCDTDAESGCVKDGGVQNNLIRLPPDPANCGIEYNWAPFGRWIEERPHRYGL